MFGIVLEGKKTRSYNRRNTVLVCIVIVDMNKLQIICSLFDMSLNILKTHNVCGDTL